MTQKALFATSVSLMVVMMVIVYLLTINILI